MTEDIRERPITVICIILAIFLVSIWFLSDAEFGPNEAASNAMFTVTTRHYGVDTREIERTISIPMEDALAALCGAVWTSSSSEYGKSTVSVRFEDSVKPPDAAELLRDAVERVYGRLSSSVQKPEIRSLSEGSGPIWIGWADIPPDRNGISLEKTVKPAFEKLDGAGLVEVSGSGQNEIFLLMDEEKIAHSALHMDEIAVSLASIDCLASAGSRRLGNSSIPIIIDGRYQSIEGIGSHFYSDENTLPISIDSIAELEERERQAWQRSAINGVEKPLIAIMPSGTANLIKLSKDIQRECKILEKDYGIEFKTILDAGEEITASFASALRAVIIATLSTGLACIFFFSDKNSRKRVYGYLPLITLPYLMLLALAILSLCSVSLDSFVLSGIAAGMGGAGEAMIVGAHYLSGNCSSVDKKRSVKKLTKVLAGGMMTTVIVLVPLSKMDYLAEGTGSLALALGIISLISFLMTSLVLPVFNPLAESCTVRHSSPVIRISAWLAERTVRRNKIIVTAFILVSIFAVIALRFSRISIKNTVHGNRVEAYIEFDAGRTIESVNEKLLAFAGRLHTIEGIGTVYSTARSGSASLVLEYSPEILKRSQAVEVLETLPLDGGFVWIPQSTESESTWQIKIFGDDDELCRRIAKSIANEVALKDIPGAIVFEFKEGPEDLIIKPDRKLTAMAGIPFFKIGEAIRRSVFAPVLYKRIGEDGETDLRIGIVREQDAGIDGLLDTVINSVRGPVRIRSFVNLIRSRDVQTVKREDRRRVASMIIKTKESDPFKLKSELSQIFKNQYLPPSYSIHFDPEAIEKAIKLKGSIWLFLLALFFCYGALAILSESFVFPIVPIIALVPSLSFPLLLLTLGGGTINPSISCAFVAVSGMVINSSILLAQEIRERMKGRKITRMDIYAVSVKNLPVLCAISVCSITGSFPFLFLNESGNSLARAISFVALCGGMAAFFVTVFFIPALANLFPFLLETKTALAGKELNDEKNRSIDNSISF